MRFGDQDLCRGGDLVQILADRPKLNLSTLPPVHSEDLDSRHFDGVARDLAGDFDLEVVLL